MRESRQVEGLYGEEIGDFGRQSLIGDKVTYQELPARAVTCKVRTRPFAMEPQVNVHGFGLPQEIDLYVVGQAYVSHCRQPLRKALDERTRGVECLVARPYGPKPALISRRVTKRLQSSNNSGPCRSRPPYGMDGNRRSLDRMLGCAWHALDHRFAPRPVPRRILTYYVNGRSGSPLWTHPPVVLLGGQVDDRDRDLAERDAFAVGGLGDDRLRPASAPPS